MIKKNFYLLRSFVFVILLLSFLFLPSLNNHPQLVSADNYNLEIELPSNNNHFLSGEKIYFTTKILNLGNKARVDVVLTYSLSDSKGDVLTKRSETVAIETQASFVGSLDIPKNLDSGSYDLVVKLVGDEGSLSSANTLIFIDSKNELKHFLKDNFWWLVLVLIAFVLLIFFFYLRPLIIHLHERGRLQGRIREIFKMKVLGNKISKEELNNSSLPKTGSDSVSEEKIF